MGVASLVSMYLPCVISTMQHLQCARHNAKTFMHADSFTPCNWRRQALLSPVFSRWKLRPREVMSVAWSHGTGRLQSWECFRPAGFRAVCVHVCGCVCAVLPQIQNRTAPPWSPHLGCLFRKPPLFCTVCRSEDKPLRAILSTSP